MGLNCSHGAFDGAYSAFNRFRQAVAAAVGGSYPPHLDPEVLKRLEVNNATSDRWYVPDEVSRETWPGLYCFLEHEDCDGEISPEDCVKVASDLSKLIDKMPVDSGGGHIERAGGYSEVLKAFIAGCQLAASQGEPLIFH